MSSKGAPLAFHAPDRDALDIQLVAQLNHGDATAFRGIFDAYAASLVLYARSLLNAGVQPAEDIVHDLFTYLWTHRHTIDVQSSLRTYLYRATRNRCCSVLRHERVLKAAQEEMGLEKADRMG
jgi:RNA polymerase sigma factor (sigma-70 family)